MTADLKGFFSNCFVGGEVGTVHRDDRWVRDRIDLRLGGRDVSILQKPEGLAMSANRFNGSFVPTTTVIVRGVRSEERSDVRELLERLAYLLSFAGCSEVACYGWEHDDEPPMREHWATVARARFFRPTLAIRQVGVVRGYLEGVWPRYVRLERQRDLRRTIDLFVRAETQGLPLELKLSTLFMLLENFASRYAREAGYAFKRGKWQKPDGERPGLRALLVEMLGGAGMGQPDLRPVVDLRNEIVHSAASEAPYEHQWEIYGRCQDVAREYLLRSWGYSGEFQLYGGRGMGKKLI